MGMDGELETRSGNGDLVGTSTRTSTCLDFFNLLNQEGIEMVSCMRGLLLFFLLLLT